VTPDLMTRSAALPEPAQPNGSGYAIGFGHRYGHHNNGHHNNDGHDHAAVLTSWKDIARYMGKGVRTVQRWEQDFGLPVRRPYGSNKKAILARPRDLDAWVAMRCGSRTTFEIPDRDPDSLRTSHLARLCALNAEVQTARMLRESNQELMREVSAALMELRASIAAMDLTSRA